VGTGAPRALRSSLDPAVIDRLAVGIVVRAEGDELETFRARFEGPCHLGRHANGVQGADVEELLVELYPPVAGEDHIDLLGVPVAMYEG
jgi:hypothetical protein